MDLMVEDKIAVEIKRVGPKMSIPLKLQIEASARFSGMVGMGINFRASIDILAKDGTKPHVYLTNGFKPSLCASEDDSDSEG